MVPALRGDLLDRGKAVKGESVKVSFNSEVVMARYNICWKSKFSHLGLGESRVQVLLVRRRGKTGERSRAKTRLTRYYWTPDDVYARYWQRHESVTHWPY